MESYIDKKYLQTLVPAGSTEPTYCTTFGCGKVLKPVEQLAGTKCTDCMITNGSMNKKDRRFKHYKF